MLTDSLRQSPFPLVPEAALCLLTDLRSMDTRAALGKVRTDDIPSDIRQFSAPDRYARFELASPQDDLVVLIVWQPGQFSPAHDHGGSCCTFRVLRGVATEQRFEPTADHRVRLVQEDRFLPGSIVSCDGEDIHAMGNDKASAEPLVTLHVYRHRPVMREHEIVTGAGS